MSGKAHICFDLCGELWADMAAKLFDIAGPVSVIGLSACSGIQSGAGAV